LQLQHGARASVQVALASRHWALAQASVCSCFAIAQI
jgi:hypothetical protein